MDEHSITPPPELAQQWLLEAHHKEAPPGTCPDTRILIARAAQWGADQELEACCEWLARELICDGKHVATDLRMIRRPKPPSLKEQALDVLQRYTSGEIVLMDSGIETIRRALEQLDG